jgi:hypothetical protein
VVTRLVDLRVSSGAGEELVVARKGKRQGADHAAGPRPSERGEGPGDPQLRWSVGVLLALFAAFVAVGLVIYAPALNGEFISDDGHYVAENPYVHDLTLDNIAAILDPMSVVARLVENYAPVHLFLHAAEWQLFGNRVFGYHVVNVVVHALGSLLFVLLLSRSGVSRAAAMLCGAVFLVHPANVEAVAWISQLKTTSAFVLCLLALLLRTDRPLAAALLFALALLAKPTAAVALPVAVLLDWSAASRSAGERARASRPPLQWRWYGLWLLIFLAFAVVEFAAFSQTAGQAPPLYPELGVRFRTTVAIALRYLVMAASGWGLSAFHEPPPATSVLDAWWLASLLVLSLLGWRLVHVLRSRSAESAYWAWALVSFAPVCGVIPLPYPMADRYLYFILPGLLGAAAFMAVDAAALLRRTPVWQGVTDVGRAPDRPRILVGGLVVLLSSVFAVQANARAGIWKTAFGLMTDAELHYPEGTAAKTREARRAALAGDVEGAVAALRAAYARGYNRLDHLLQDSAYAPLRSDPRFSALLTEIAVEWRDRLGSSESPSQIELRAVAQANVVLEDYEAALRALERALEVGGPVDEEIRYDIEEVERALRFQELRRKRRAPQR